MYNRYLSGAYIPEEAPQEIDLSPVSEPTVPPPVERQEHKPSGVDLTGALAGFLRNLKFDTDDLLLFAIIWLLLRDSGDDDVLLIVAALFFLGFFGDE